MTAVVISTITTIATSDSSPTPTPPPQTDVRVDSGLLQPWAPGFHKIWGCRAPVPTKSFPFSSCGVIYKEAVSMLQSQISIHTYI